MDIIEIGRTFPLENYANLRVNLQTSLAVNEPVTEEERKTLRLLMLAEIEQAFYEYNTIASTFNLAKYKNPDEVIKALEVFKQSLYNRLKVKSEVENTGE